MPINIGDDGNLHLGKIVICGPAYLFSYVRQTMPAGEAIDPLAAKQCDDALTNDTPLARAYREGQRK